MYGISKSRALRHRPVLQRVLRVHGGQVLVEGVALRRQVVAAARLVRPRPARPGAAGHIDCLLTILVRVEDSI